MSSEKFIIYQLLPRLFGNTNQNCVPDGSFIENGSGKFDDISSSVLKELKKLSISYIWLTGIIRHATEGDISAKGKAGSPFAIKDYYDVNPYLSTNPENRLKEFKALITRIHKTHLKVLVDFVPNHVSAQYNSVLVPFTDENFYSGKICDYDWTDTVKLNYSNRDTWIKMRDILLFWCSKGVDGFRCDMVELVPVEFWSWCIPQIKTKYPEVIFIAEIYQPSNYRAYIQSGFDYLYDKAGFYDHLRAISQGNKPASALTGVWQSLGSLQPKMLNFLENHDEQRLASDFYLGAPEKAYASLFVSLFFNTAPFMLYSGQEFGERGMDREGFSGIDGKTSIYDFWSIKSIRHWLDGNMSVSEKAVYSVYKLLLTEAMSIKAIRKGLTYDLEYANPGNNDFNPDKHFAFLRYSDDELFLCVANFSQTEQNIKVYIPREAFDYFGLESYLSGLQVSVKVASFSGILQKL